MTKYKVTYTSMSGTKTSHTFEDVKEAKKQMKVAFGFIELFGGKMEYEKFNVLQK